MDTVADGLKEAARIKRELRRLKFLVPAEMKAVVAALERMCAALEKRLKAAK
jgi:hypothetical protein